MDLEVIENIIAYDKAWNSRFVTEYEAKMLKSVGFDLPCLIVWYNGELHQQDGRHDWNADDDEMCSAPLYKDVEKWFNINYKVMEQTIGLRPYQIGDAEDLYKILSNPNFTYFKSSPKSLADEIRYINECIENFKNGTFYNYAIVLNGEVIGGIGVKVFTHRNYIGELGYFLEERHWGKGIISQALKTMEDICFEFIGLTRLEIIMQPKNTSSERVAIKNGYEKEGLLKKVIKDKEGNLKDVYLYSKTL